MPLRSESLQRVRQTANSSSLRSVRLPHSGATLATAKVALIGNPNTGKTTLFNVLTGMSQRVGNYPGVTVERKSGSVNLPDGTRAELFDLPGTYSLAAASPDEMIAVDVLLDDTESRRVDAVIAIVDAGNLRRNLYLVSQILETGRPVVIALNMTDVATARGIHIDAIGLSNRLGVPVIPISAQRRQGIDELRVALADVLAGPLQKPALTPLPDDLQRQVTRLVQWSSGNDRSVHGARPLVAAEALRAIVDQEGATEARLVAEGTPDATGVLAGMRAAVGASQPLSALESDARYNWVQQMLEGTVTQSDELSASRSDRVDRVLTHRLVGLVIFVGISAVLFQGIYSWSAPLMDIIEGIFGELSNLTSDALPEGALRSMIVDGVIAGVGGVLIFLPQIAMLFLLISVLEDCGYMARAALLMDRLLGNLGLSGRSFIPLLSSFACAVPGVMAARTIADRRDRFVTILVAPLMSCSARLPVYVLFIAAFIPDRTIFGGWIGLQGLTLLAMYSVGAIVAIPVALLLRLTILRGTSSPFLLELPAYNWPTPRTVLLRVYGSCRAFIVRAGSVILAATIAMWALAYFPHSEALSQTFANERSAALALPAAEQAEQLENLDRAEAAAHLEASLLGRAGHFVQPMFDPLGWDWRIGMATLASFPAREIVISALGTIYSLGGDHDESSGDMRRGLQAAVHADGTPVFTIPVALSVMVFFALCAQCMSTLAVIQRETQSWGWTGFSFSYMTVLAYVTAFGVYHLGTWLGW
jgi:ferrous iron transport protein B